MLERHPFLARIRKTALTPWGVVGSALLFRVMDEHIISPLLVGGSARASLRSLWTTLMTFADQPIIELLMIPLAIWCFYRAGEQVRRSDERLELQRTEERKAISSQVSNALLGLVESGKASLNNQAQSALRILPNKAETNAILEHYVASRKLEAVDDSILVLNDLAESEIQVMASLLRKRPDNAIHRYSENTVLKSIQDKLRRSSVPFEQIRHVVGDDELDYIRIPDIHADIDDKKLLQKTIRRNQKIRESLDQLRERYAERTRDAAYRIDNLDDYK